MLRSKQATVYTVEVSISVEGGKGHEGEEVK